MDTADHTMNTVTLFASQAEPVWQAVLRDGAAYSKAAYVRKKYGESAPVFLTAYDWFVGQLPRFVPKPPVAEYPYWAFGDQYLMEAGSASRILRLEVPVGEAVFFDMYDWNRIMQMQYLGKDPGEERAFRQELALRGITPSEVMLTAFYPELRARVCASWQRLFRHHEAVRQGDRTGVGSLQAGLWCIRREWVTDVR